MGDDANADTNPLPENEQPKSSRRRSRENDISRLSKSGNSLYELLDIPRLPRLQKSRRNIEG